MKKRHPLLKRSLYFLTILFLFLYGLISLIIILAETRTSLHSEQDQHLMDLSSMTDHNVTSIMDRIRQDISTASSRPSVAAAEDNFLKFGKAGTLRSYLNDLPILETTYAKRILVFSDGDCVLSNVGGEDSSYRFYSQDPSTNLDLIENTSTGELFIGFSTPSSYTSLVYVALISPEALFRRAVSESIYNQYWIVLYDTESGMTLHNVATRTNYLIIDKNEMSSRNDGFSVIGDFIGAGEKGATIYTFDSGAADGVPGQLKEACIAVIPEVSSENGYFTVAVASYLDTASSTIIRSVMIFVSAVALVTAISMLIFYTLHTGAREKELSAELTALEKESEIKEKLLKDQETLTHHQKLETIGTLTAGVAHEFNNLLAPIMGSSMLILENTPPENEDIYDNALDIYNASRRAKELVSRISRLSRKSSASSMQTISPSALINGVLSMISATTPKNVLVETHIDTTDTILGDESLLSHMFLNLIINALQAMEPDGGILQIDVKSDTKNVIFAISDSGTGIPEDKLPHIFEPFFTTKAAGKGTGLGLPICQQTATDHKGTITAENRPEGGARFTVTIPIHSADEIWDD